MNRLTWLALTLFFSTASLTAQANDGHVTANVNMRAGPDIDYPRITTIRAGSLISVQGCVDDYDWCDVVAYGERGWMSGDYIEYDYQSRRVPLYSHGAQFGIPIISFILGDYWGSHYNHRSFYRDRARWSNHPIRHRGSNYGRGDRHDGRRDGRRDDRRDGRRDGRRDDQRGTRRDGHNEVRSDARNAQQRDTRYSDRGNLSQMPRAARQRDAAEPARQPLSESRRAQAPAAQAAESATRSDANRGPRHGRSNPAEQRQQHEGRGSNDGKSEDGGRRRGRGGNDDNDDKKDDRGDRGRQR